MIRFKAKKQNVAWLIGMGLLTTFALLAPNINPLTALLLMGAFGVATVGSLVDLSNTQTNLQSVNQRVARNRLGQSPQAQEAEARAKSRASYQPTEVRLVDVGIIATLTDEDGMSMRRARQVSKDDDGIRPFISLHVPPHMADRHVTVRYEITDHTGTDQYAYDMRVLMRDGKMNILADTHLPMFDNAHITGAGKWDLRVYVDGTLIGIHDFMHTLSVAERLGRVPKRRTDANGEIRNAEKRLRADDLNVPLSLEELIRNQSDEKGGGAK